MAATATCGAGAGTRGSVAVAVDRSTATSFQRRGPRAGGADGSGPRLVSIAGTRPSVRNGQLLVSTGLPALDQLLGRFRRRSGSAEGGDAAWAAHLAVPVPVPVPGLCLSVPGRGEPRPCGRRRRVASGLPQRPLCALAGFQPPGPSTSLGEGAADRETA